MTFSVRQRYSKYDVNLLLSSALTQRDIVNNEVKRNKTIHHPHMAGGEMTDVVTVLQWFYILQIGKCGDDTKLKEWVIGLKNRQVTDFFFFKIHNHIPMYVFQLWDLILLILMHMLSFTHKLTH